MQVYFGFPQLLLTRNLTYEKALGSACEEKRQKETEASRARVQSMDLPLPARLLRRNQLPKVLRAPVPSEKAFTLFLLRTCGQTCFAPWHLSPACGPYLQRERLDGLFRHVVHERPKQSFLFSVHIQSLGGKAQGEQLRLIPAPRGRMRWISPILFPASPGTPALVWYWLGWSSVSAWSFGEEP